MNALIAGSRARIAALFPELTPQIRRVTLLPPLARRLGPLTALLYPLLAVLAPLRTHELGLLALSQGASPSPGVTFLSGPSQHGNRPLGACQHLSSNMTCSGSANAGFSRAKTSATCPLVVRADALTMGHGVKRGG